MTFDLDHLMDLESKATEGPWDEEAASGDHNLVSHNQSGDVGSVDRWDDAVFISTLRNAAKEMMAELRALRELERDVKSYMDGDVDAIPLLLTALAAVEKARGEK